MMKILQIKPGDLVFPRSILLDPVKYSNELNNYNLWIYHTFKHIYEKKLHLRHIKLDILKMLDFETSLAEFSAAARKTERISLNELSKRTKIQWADVLGKLLSNLDVSIKEDDIVVVSDVDNLKELIEFVNNQETRTVGTLSLIKCPKQKLTA